MPAFNLPAAAKRQGLRRNTTLRPIEPTQAHAQELAALYLAVVRAWQRNLPAIMAGYTVPTLDSLTTDAPRDHQQAIDRVEDEIARLVRAFGFGVERFTTRIERWHRSRWQAAVRAGTGIDLTAILTAQPAAETIEAFIARNVALVKDISAQTQGRIADAVFRAYQNRTPTRELAKELREAVDLGRKRSLRVASHQNNALSSALDTQRMAEAGIDLWKWRHSGKRNPRLEHKAKDGRIYRLGSNKRVNPDGTALPDGETIEAGQGPSELPNCGCRKQAYLPIMATL